MREKKKIVYVSDNEKEFDTREGAVREDTLFKLETLVKNSKIDYDPDERDIAFFIFENFTKIKEIFKELENELL